MAFVPTINPVIAAAIAEVPNPSDVPTPQSQRCANLLRRLQAAQIQASTVCHFLLTATKLAPTKLAFEVLTFRREFARAGQGVRGVTQ